jgi:hypothetical protein
VVTRLELLDDSNGVTRERDLREPQLVLGRGEYADWSFGDSAVSRRHAAIHHSPDHDEIEDLGSMAGTLVNGIRVDGRRALHPGDVVQLASVRLRYVGDHPGTTMAVPTTDPRASNVAFDVDQQRAGVISNVGGNQYNSYVQQVMVSREDAFRAIAPLSRVARMLLIVGFSVAVAGVLGAIGSVLLEIAKGTPDMSSPEAFQESTEMTEVFGVPVFAVAFGVALVGMGLFFLGLITQLAVWTRKKDVDRRYPLPPGWGGH